MLCAVAVTEAGQYPVVTSKQLLLPFSLEMKRYEDISEIDSIRPEKLSPFQWMNQMKE
jgi:hypothetical protein